MPSKIERVCQRAGGGFYVIRRSTGHGVCDTCGSPEGSPTLYQYGFEFPDGNFWTDGEYCSQPCWKARKDRLSEARRIAKIRKTPKKTVRRNK